MSKAREDRMIERANEFNNQLLSHLEQQGYSGTGVLEEHKEAIRFLIAKVAELSIEIDELKEKA